MRCSEASINLFIDVIHASHHPCDGVIHQAVPHFIERRIQVFPNLRFHLRPIALVRDSAETGHTQGNRQACDTLMALAAEEARLATDYFQFTSLINKNFSAGQKVQVVEYLWQVAYADGQLDAHEQHFMRKIADLLYVSHADYVAAKQRARDQA